MVVAEDTGSSRQSHQASRPTMALFGPKLAPVLVQQYQQIHNSGMLYSPEWKSREIPDDLLFLSLRAPRFAQADNRTLNKLIRDFQLLELLPRIINDWSLEEQFPELCTTSRNQWQSSRACQRCLIFVARAYRCMYALEWTNIRDSLAVKVLRCLKILRELISKEPKVSSPPLQYEASVPMHQLKANQNAPNTNSLSPE
jgi:hypothetical protein